MANNIVYSRIDYRLLHGQVITRWRPKYSITKFVVVDEEGAKDSFQQLIIKSVAPKGTNSVIVSPEKAGEMFANEEFTNGTYMVIFRNVTNLYNAYQAGLKITELCLGNMPPTDNSKSIYRAVHLTEEDAKKLLELEKNGVKIYCSDVPNDAPVPLDTGVSKAYPHLL